MKRKKEILERMAEIRATLEGTEALSEEQIDALETEARNLETELAGIERRSQIAAGINAGTVETRAAAPNPITGEVPGATPPAGGGEDSRNIVDTPEYRSAWLKNMRNLELNAAEQRTITTADGSAGKAVPTTTRNKIIEKVHQYCPMLDKIDLLRVPGGVKIPAEGTTVDAKTHTEGAPITGDADTIIAVVLSGYEVTKLVTISKSVEKMTIDAFEDWLARKVGRKVAEKISALIFNGTGTNEAQGVNAITWNATNSVTVAASASPTAANIKTLVGLLNGGYDDGAEWYMKKQTFFTDIHPLMDNSKDNIVTYDPATGKYRIMGYPVNFDDRLTLHEAILGDFFLGYVGNMPEDVTVTSDFVVRENSYDFLGCAMFDGKVQATEAFVKLVKATA